MIQEHIQGNITDIDENGTLRIIAFCPSIDRALHREYSTCEIILNDGRRISPEQRRKIYALIGEIAEYVEGVKNASTIEETKKLMKWDFLLKCMEAQERKIFSLANCDMSTAREFISYLIDFIISQDIPTAISLIENCEDIEKYIYSCAMHRKCAVCGREAQIHHCEGSRIGVGLDRSQVHHLGRECLPLCREHHTICHNDEKAFISKYHLEPVKIDEKICRVYRLKK